jgi:translation initiation factor 2B subunit (eIF-2B alpha/beta/delta family)
VSASRGEAHRFFSSIPFDVEELSIGNVVRRILFFVREVAMSTEKETTTAPHLQRTLSAILTESVVTTPRSTSQCAPRVAHPPAVGGGHARSQIIENVKELIDEIDGVYAQISDYSVEHIHAKSPPPKPR